jgi:transcriptional regulator
MRGRPRFLEPRRRDLKILKLVKRGYRQSHIAVLYGLTRQRINQIIDRWKGVKINYAKR